jgi:uncharacterized protein
MVRKFVVAVVECVFVIALVQLCPAQNTCPTQRLISVLGTAELNVPPDEALLTFGVENHDKVLSTAKSQNDARLKKVLSVAHAAGVEQKDIKTSTLQMSPDYSDEKIPRLIGYEVSQTIAITLKDISKYEDLMTQLLDAGVNRVDGIYFQVGEPRKYRDEARSKAIDVAKEKAIAMATQLGQTVGKPWEISEQGADREVFASLTAGKARERYGYNSGDATVAPGQVTISASVKVSFQLE